MKSSLYTILFFVLFFNIYKVKAQDQEDPRKQYIPNITVASPQAAAISKVGEIPIDLSTGRMNYTIPIFEIKEGDFTMPINLSYNYSGLLLDETPGYAGVGWTFNIGGSILHSINGLDDVGHEYNKETVYKYINKLPPYDDYLSPAGLSAINNFTEFVANGIIDGEPDKYSVNVGNLNCSFYLNKDNNAIFLKNENYKVSGYSHSGFTITDDQGINYIFNKPLNNSRSSGENSSDYIASFLLTEINFPTTTNKILFEYDAVATTYTDKSISQTLTQNSTQYVHAQSFELNNNIAYTTIETNKLKKIITNNYTIELRYSNNPTEPSIAVISNLSVKDKFSKAIKSYDFTYSGWIGRRANLLNVMYNGFVTNEMEYDMSTPYPIVTDDSDYAKKDLWGYYNQNGRPATVSGLITPDNNPYLKPDFNSTKIGALTKITYQTKGYSSIEYEANKVRVGENNFPYESDAPVITESYAVTTNPNEISSKKTLTLNITSVPVDLIPRYQFTNGFEMAGEHDRNGEITLTQNGTIILKAKQYWGRELGTWTPPQRTIMNSDPANIIHITSPGTYVLEAISDQGITAELSVMIKKTPPTYDQTVGGIRVKQTKNCDFNGECITTVYNYSQDNKSTGVMLQRPEFYSGSHTQDNLQCSPAIFVRRDFYNYTSIYPLSNFRGSPVLYKTVEKIDSGKNENNELVTNGKTIFSYYGEPVSNSILDLESYSLIGLLKTKEVKNNSDTTLFKESNSYSISIIPNTTKFLYLLSCKLVREKRRQLSGGGSSGAGCGLQYPRPLLDFQVASFKYQAKNLILEKEESANYFQGSIVEGMTVYDYNPDTGFLKSKTTKNSKKEDLATKYFYPGDNEMASEPFRNELIAKNRIKTPLVVQNYNEVKLSEQKTEYAQDASTSNFLLPKYIYINKGTASIDNSIDKKITYDLYDDKGNILQYTPESGIPVSIIWGYNKTLPIAKIENANQDQISSYVLNLQNLSDADNDNCTAGSCKEEALRKALNDLRTTLPQSMVSTYTYDPLVGVTSITDTKGISAYYEYDSLSRLKFAKDHNLNVLNSYCYNYKGQISDCIATPSVVYKSVQKSGVFGKNDCDPQTISYNTMYVVPAGKYTSTLSQADADRKAQKDVDVNGQVFANSTILCYYKSKKISEQFTKNDCQGDALPPENTYHTIEAGTYGSIISQEQADALAQGEMDKYGQLYVNQNNECIYKSKAISKFFTKNNCGINVEPSEGAYYIVEAGKYISTISQADADTQALTDLNTNGQDYINSRSNCITVYKNEFVLGFFSKNDCDLGGIPAQQIFGIGRGEYTSTISQADADAKAQAELPIRGQAYANEHGYCTYKNKERFGYFQKTNCPYPFTGEYMLYYVPEGKYSGSSQEEADRIAELDIDAYGQDYVNTQGSCTF
ncbi:DUF5977 domain-containing protein [Flavobacterium oncorhynchi]|uniref:DUF5977 domain-containing protein n=1 Tax=Flavobacterium oncorhynchi TaxID=728056 RepID=UPI00351A9C18